MQSKRDIEKCPKIRSETTITFLDYRIKILMLSNTWRWHAIHENYLTENLGQSEC